MIYFGSIKLWIESFKKGSRLWPGNSYRRAAEMLRDDLKAAKIAYRDKDGKVVDFHALRHTYITSLHRNGVHGKVLQELARHSVGWLTERYTHVDEEEKEQAVRKLPDAPKLPGIKGLGSPYGTPRKSV